MRGSSFANGDDSVKKVYTCFTTDIIHEGHLNILREARKYGNVTIGALSDKALIRYNRFPTVSLEDRIALYRSLEGVDDVKYILSDEGREAVIKTHVEGITNYIKNTY